MSLATAAGRPVNIWREPARIARAPPRRPERGHRRARWGDGRAGVRAVSPRTLPLVRVAPNRQTRRLEVVRRPRKCLHYYLYLIDPEFGGRMSGSRPGAVRDPGLRQWPRVAGAATRCGGIGYRRSDNKITAVDDFAAVAALCQRFAHTDWPPFLERQAPWSIRCCPPSTHAGFPGYWWVIDQCEYASDSCSPSARPW